MFPTASHIKAVGPEQPFYDGYGLPFSPDLHATYIRIALHDHERYPSSISVPHVEPVWKDRPAGFKVCPAIYEDKGCESFPG